MKSIRNAVWDLIHAWMEARAEQAKYYSKHNHIE
ncbi:MAG: hypothetical protein RIQ76_720 [Pseudomonadota bacterium]